MLWRLWCFVAGLPLGALALVAARQIAARGEAPAVGELELGAVLGGLALLFVASLVARYRDDDHDRGLHLSVSASTAFAAAPALLCALAGLPPPPVVSLCVVLSVLGISLLRGAWQRGPAGGFWRRAAVAVAWAAIAGIALVSFETVNAGFGVGVPEPAPAVRTAIFDFDARVPTLALPRCNPRPAAIDVVADRGAHPRFSPDGSSVWFDASTKTGTRQIHRLVLAQGSVQCWTCGEEGNNMRPAPSGNGAGVVFDTDRWETWAAPFNTELQLIGAGSEEAGSGSRRLTVSPGADDHAVFGPGSSVLAWSRGGSGHYAVVSGAIRSGHGGLILGGIRVLYDGGSSWTAPLAWSPDARSLVVVHGNPLRPLGAYVVDPATGSESSSGDEVSGLASASFTADGGWLAVATTERATVAGLVSGRLGFLLAPLATRGNASVRFRGTGVRAGEPKGEGTSLELGEVAGWGEPTGVALAPDGRSFVLGQRRTTDRGVEERLVRVTLECSSSDGV
ncbi:MAG TPA: hypothetical protein DEP35_23680 [Deltaproteobacteria bacterium]|nr:hypothetical protein [Deltaproteobacteria bacterium]